MAITTANLSGLVINEIGTSPNAPSHDLNGDGLGNGDDEFIELFNTSGAAVDISGWQVWEINSGTISNTTSGILHQFAPGTTLAAGGYIVVVDTSGGTTAPNTTLANGVYMDPQASGAPFGTPTFMSLTDTDIVILYDPGTNTYVRFDGEEASVDSQNLAASTFAGATQVGPTESGIEDNAGNSAQRSPDGETTWTDAPVTPGVMNCFLTGTLIATPAGERAVQDLGPGDTVVNAAGQAVCVKWVGRQTVSPRFGPAERLMPIRFSAGALGAGLPHSDLFVTADHGMIVDGLLIQAAALVNGTTITAVPLSEMGGRYTVYHVEADRHEVLLANGAAAESLVTTRPAAPLTTTAIISICTDPRRPYLNWTCPASWPNVWFPKRSRPGWVSRT